MFARCTAFFVVIFAMYCACGTAMAQSVTYTIDTSHTRVVYGISHLGFSMMPGRFHDISGTLVFDPQSPEASQVDIVINPVSVTMDHAVLDKKLVEENFFNTRAYPTITFKSAKIVKTGDKTGTVTGDVTLLGVTKPVTLDVTFNKKAFNKYAGAETVGFSATGKIKRSDFGMTYLLPDVGDDVLLNIQLEATAPKQDPAKKDNGAVDAN